MNEAMLDVQEYAAKQAEGIAKIASETKADPILTHDQSLRQIISALDENDTRVAMEIIVAKDPFIVFDALRNHVKELTDDLNNIHKILDDRDEKIHYICGGNN